VALIVVIGWIIARWRSVTPGFTDPVFEKVGATDDEGWFAFDPVPDPFSSAAAIDLRSLNERAAGESGFVSVSGGRFVQGPSGHPVRFWAMNGPPPDLDRTALRRCARLLAKRGVNLVRIHRPSFGADGEADASAIRYTIETVEALKGEGIYSYLSIYFPLWLAPKPGTPWLEGYDGKKHPFAALEFNGEFQRHYRAWWEAILTTPSPTTGRRLVDEPAVAGVEIQNEDSFFFWTFSRETIPDLELQILERMFGDWLVKRYGSLEAAFSRWDAAAASHDARVGYGVGALWTRLRSAIARWKDGRDSPDAPEEGRVAFRPLSKIIRDRTLRDQDTVRFLFETQAAFYSQTINYLRELGFKGVITASNWTTASTEILDPIEKLSYLAGDVMDRHGYFECQHRGPESEWSIRVGHTYVDRSALRFDGEELTTKDFSNPAMDTHFDGKPSMLSETTWSRPNRFRSEAPLFLAAYGSLQLTDAIVHFALDGDHWTVKPQRVVQPWTLMTPAMLGQFPAAALIFRRGLVAPGAVVAEVDLNREDLFALRGGPVSQDARLDELRRRDAPGGADDAPIGQELDPRMHHVGRVEVRFKDSVSSMKLREMTPFIDSVAQRVVSSTGELKLDYRSGLLVIDAPRAQGSSGRLKGAGRIETQDLEIASEMDPGHIVVVTLDGQPLATAKRILLQVMSEERLTGYRTEPASPGVERIVSLGRDPWRVRKLQGVVRFKRRDAAQLKVTALDFNGYPVSYAGTAEHIELAPTVLYYLISR
jgi:hypothetical protein